MPYELEMAQLAKGAVAAHGQLKEVVFLEANKDSLLVFSDGAVIPALHHQHGYDIRREAYAMQLAREYSGTDYFSLLAFGYSGTGPTCYAAFLSAAGFQSTNVESLVAPLKLRFDGSEVSGAEQNGAIKWEDGSETPAPSAGKRRNTSGPSGMPRDGVRLPTAPQVSPARKEPATAPAKRKWWAFWLSSDLK